MSSRIREGYRAVALQVDEIAGVAHEPDGAPTGGIPASALDPAQPRYLEVEVEGYPASTPMEIASARF